MKMFMADDSPQRQGSLTITLAPGKEPVSIGSAYGATAAASPVQRVCPDVVILEPNINGGNGFEALKEIQKTNPEANVIVLSASTSPQVRRRCAETVMDFCLDKDVEHEKMAQITREIAADAAQLIRQFPHA